MEDTQAAKAGIANQPNCIRFSTQKKLMKFNWASKSVLIALVALSVFLGQQKFRQYRLQKAIETEKLGLESKLKELQGKNMQLTETLSFLDSPDYKELVARQQLNMQKAGEFVYSFSEKSEDNSTEVDPNADKSNFQKWSDYFLNNR